MSFSHFRLAALGAALVIVAFAACGDSLGLPPAAFENQHDTTTLFALQGTSIDAPSGFDIVSRLRSRTELGEPFDVAFDIDASSRPLLYPASALGVLNQAALQLTSDAFGNINRAPLDGYQLDSAIVLRPGLVFLGRSRVSSQFCGFLGSLPRFGKFRVIAVDQGLRSVTFEHIVNVNCGFRGLQPGLPTN